MPGVTVRLSLSMSDCAECKRLLAEYDEAERLHEAMLSQLNAAIIEGKTGHEERLRLWTLVQDVNVARYHALMRLREHRIEKHQEESAGPRRREPGVST
jgi:hypothetical protein